FLEQEYGKDNLLYATVHNAKEFSHMHYGVVPITDDGRLSVEKTPHMHYGVVPITDDGRLSAKGRMWG
ncbi:plasmid recombination protein, partial [Staphylococcus aureus]|nr:plasmid recombination protein [Staphylococcus aureus]